MWYDLTGGDLVVQPHELKEYITKEDKLLFLLEELGIEEIKDFGSEYRWGKGNKVRIKKEYLSVVNFKTSEKGDIFTLVMDKLGVGFAKANSYIHRKLNLKNEYKKQEIKKDPFSSFFGKFGKVREDEDIEIKTYQYNLNNMFTDMLHENWYKEGISTKTASDFEIMWCSERKRIVIPHRHWEGKGYLGVVGRTMVDNYTSKDIPKYTKVLPKNEQMMKSYNLYGLYENYYHIQKAGYVVVYESEKSVLKRYSLNDKTGIALCCSTMSNEQFNILMGLNVDIVVALDEGLDKVYTYDICDKFLYKRRIFFINYSCADFKVPKKISIADLDEKYYSVIFDNKIEYTEEHRKEYIQIIN